MDNDDIASVALGRRLLLLGHFAEPVVIDVLDDFGDVLMLGIRTGGGEPPNAFAQLADTTLKIETGHGFRTLAEALASAPSEECRG